MSVIARILVVIFAYFLACIGASIILTVGTLTPEWDDLAAAGFHSGAMWAVVFVIGTVIAAIAMLPAMLVILLAEGFGWRSILIYGALGGALALSLSYGLDFSGYAGEPDSVLTRGREVFAASGIAGGFVYWLIAGRRAGAWK